MMAAIDDSAGQPADRRRTDVRATSAGEADVRNRFAELGLTPRTGWYTSVALYAVGAIPAIALPLIDPAHFSRVFLWLGLVALLIAALSVVGLRYFPNSIKAAHMRLSIGLMIQTFGAVVVGDARLAFVLLPLTTILPPAIYFGVREAATYAAAAAVVVEGADRDELDRLAARIRASIAHTRSRVCANLLADASVVCVYVEHGDDGDRLLARSDAALHERKRETRLERIDAVA